MASSIAVNLSAIGHLADHVVTTSLAAEGTTNGVLADVRCLSLSIKCPQVNCGFYQ
jgi:hypothetical protein